MKCSFDQGCSWMLLAPSMFARSILDGTFQNGSNELVIVSQSSMIATLLSKASWTHPSKFGGGFRWYLRRYSLTASLTVLDWEANNLLFCASASSIKRWIGCSLWSSQGDQDFQFSEEVHFEVSWLAEAGVLTLLVKNTDITSHGRNAHRIHMVFEDDDEEEEEEKFDSDSKYDLDKSKAPAMRGTIYAIGLPPYTIFANRAVMMDKCNGRLWLVS